MKVGALLLLVSINAYAVDEFALNEVEINLLRKASELSPVEPYNAKKEWPQTINDGNYVEPPYVSNPKFQSWLTAQEIKNQAKTLQVKKVLDHSKQVQRIAVNPTIAKTTVK